MRLTYKQRFALYYGSSAYLKTAIFSATAFLFAAASLHSLYQSVVHTITHLSTHTLILHWMSVAGMLANIPLRNLEDQITVTDFIPRDVYEECFDFNGFNRAPFGNAFYDRKYITRMFLEVTKPRNEDLLPLWACLPGDENAVRRILATWALSVQRDS